MPHRPFIHILHSIMQFFDVENPTKVIAKPCRSFGSPLAKESVQPVKDISSPRAMFSIARF